MKPGKNRFPTGAAADAATSFLDTVRRARGCPTQAEIVDYVENHIPDDQRKALQEHVSKCPACQADVKHGHDRGRERRGLKAFQALADYLKLPLIIVLELIRPRRLRAAALPTGGALGVAAVASFAIAFGAITRVLPPTKSISTAQTVKEPALREPLDLGPVVASPYLPAVVHTASQQRTLRPMNGPASRSTSARIALTKIGQKVVSADRAGLDNEGVPVSVRRFETLEVRLAGEIPRGAHLYAAVRRDGGHWEIGDGIDAEDQGRPLKLTCQFGSQGDDLMLMDLRVLVDRDNLPAGPVPDIFLSNGSIVAISPIFRVKRTSLNRPVLAITHVNNEEIWERQIPWVYDEAPIHVYATKLPIGARIGLAVQPTRPLNESRWVQMDELDAAGTIGSRWGDPGYHAFVRFSVTAFAVGSEKDFPPKGVPIPAQEWASYSAKFIATSPSVTVVKAGEQFTIAELNERQVPINRRALVEPQADIRGLLDRPISGGERIWLICAPDDRTGGKPWIAGSTTDAMDNLWSAKAIQLWRSGQASSFELIAVFSSDDPNKIDAGALREWLNQHKTSRNRVALRIEAEH